MGETPAGGRSLLSVLICIGVLAGVEVLLAVDRLDTFRLLTFRVVFEALTETLVLDDAGLVTRTGFFGFCLKENQKPRY